MGYPMTYKRVVHRNGLARGDYSNEPPPWHATVPTVFWDAVTDMRSFAEMLVKEWGEAAERHNGKVRLLMGDLRRLEDDTVDERGPCGYIAQRTGIDPEVVAAVLKEWIAW